MNTKIKLTTEVPTDEGWYWVSYYKFFECHQPDLVRVFYFGPDLMFCRTGFSGLSSVQKPEYWEYRLWSKRVATLDVIYE